MRSHVWLLDLVDFVGQEIWYTVHYLQQLFLAQLFKWQTWKIFKRWVWSISCFMQILDFWFFIINFNFKLVFILLIKILFIILFTIRLVLLIDLFFILTEIDCFIRDIFTFKFFIWEWHDLLHLCFRQALFNSLLQPLRAFLTINDLTMNCLLKIIVHQVLLLDWTVV